MSAATKPWSIDEMQSRIVRYADLVPCRNAFVDTRTPGSDQKENFTIIGPGVSENPNQHVHIAEPHGFNIGGARQPPGCLNSQHSHLTAEVFVVHTGQWRFIFGVDASDGYIDLGPGDTISIPPDMFRGFENIGKNTGFLFAVLGQDNPGKVTWAPVVFDLAEQYGLVLLKGGKLVDTTVGEKVPEGAVREQAPTEDEIAALATPPAATCDSFIATASALVPNEASALHAQGVREYPVITPQLTDDGFHPGPISGDLANGWEHGFNLRRLELDAFAGTAMHMRDDVEILFVHAGQLAVNWSGGSTTLGKGDTLSVPVGLERSYSNPVASGTAIIYIVRGGDNPSAPRFP